MTGLYPCGVSAAIHTMLQARGIACRHCREYEAPDWKDLNSEAFAHYTTYGSCGSAPWE